MVKADHPVTAGVSCTPCDSKCLMQHKFQLTVTKRAADILTVMLSFYIIPYVTSLVVYLSGSLTTNHEVPGSIPGSTMGIFPCRQRFPW